MNADHEALERYRAEIRRQERGNHPIEDSECEVCGSLNNFSVNGNRDTQCGGCGAINSYGV